MGERQAVTLRWAQTWEVLLRGTGFAPLDAAAAVAARARHNALTKPRGALGCLERVIVQLAAVQGLETPQSRPAACLVFASDHPVTRHGVSAYPSEVTAAMVDNLAAGGAAANVLCRCQHVALTVVDVGVAYSMRNPGTTSSGYWRAECADLPAGDLRVEEAMPPETFAAAFRAGRDAVCRLAPAPRVLILGEMGIGNTTPASAVCSALLGLAADRVVGPGAGLDAQGVARKTAVVSDAVTRLRGDEAPLEVLRCVGGRELAALAGAAAEAASRRIAILVDGFIVTAALLALVRQVPAVRQFMIPAHCSREPGHRLALDGLFARSASELTVHQPLLDLKLALGEGSGGLLAFALVDLALATHGEMATFETAGVPDPT